MATKQVIKGRLLQKADTAENWEKATSFVPLKGEICIYLPDNNNEAPRFKVGDGSTLINSLPFSSEVEAISVDEINKICIE